LLLASFRLAAAGKSLLKRPGQFLVYEIMPDGTANFSILTTYKLQKKRFMKVRTFILILFLIYSISNFLTGKTLSQNQILCCRLQALKL
jgi:hypothetical protein